MKYLLVGAGPFGASTALHLKKTHPAAEVTFLGRAPFPCPSAAGHDLNKIIRAEYDDPLYMGLALEVANRPDPQALLPRDWHPVRGNPGAGTQSR